MNYKIEEYKEIENIIDILASIKEICFLPENLTEKNPSEFIYSETTTDLRKVFIVENLMINYLTDDKPLLRSRKSADWFGPTIFIGFSILADNPHLIGVSLNLISSYLYDIFKGAIGSKNVKFDVVVENKKNKEYQKISYKGNVGGIKELEGVIKSLKK